MTPEHQTLVDSTDLYSFLHCSINSRSALRLLWEEAQDKCAIRDDTTDAVEAALEEGDR